jgi:predicted RNase H-like HicB family nuclease
MAEQVTYAVVVEKGDRNYSAYVPDLPGSVTTGNTVEEALENMKEAIAFHIHGLAEDSQPIPASSTVAAQLVTVGV